MDYLIEDLEPESIDSNKSMIVDDFMFFCGYAEAQAHCAVINMFAFEHE